MGDLVTKTFQSEGVEAIQTAISNVQGGNIKESMAKTGGTPYNIITDYTWTLSPMNNIAISSKVPSIQLYEYQMTKNMLIKAIQYLATNLLAGGQGITGNGGNLTYYTNAANSTDIAYDGLFDYSNPTGYNYTFPYYNEDNISSSNNWGGIGMNEKISEIANTASPKVLDSINKSMAVYNTIQSLRYPNVGTLDKPMIWTDAARRPFKITFFLAKNPTSDKAITLELHTVPHRLQISFCIDNNTFYISSPYV